MPFYSYHCHVCKSDFTIRHGMFFEQKRCIKCHSDDNLEKIVSKVSVPRAKEEEQLKTGEVTRKHIEEYREELKVMKKEAKKTKL